MTLSHHEPRTATLEAVPTWQPESPFLQDPMREEETVLSPGQAFGPLAELESPFTSEYVSEGGATAAPGAERYTRMLGELFDPEFEEALTDLVNEAAAAAEGHFAGESMDPMRGRQDAERLVAEFLAPLEREAKAMLDQMAERAGGRDAAALTDTEVEALFEWEWEGGPLAVPAFEGFLKGLRNKVKKAVKAVAGAVGKVVPISVIIGKIKALVRPLLTRVLKHAIPKLPAAVQATARTLAAKYLGIQAEVLAEAALSEQEERASLAAADPASLSEDFDASLAAEVLSGEAQEAMPEVTAFYEEQAYDASDPLRELEEARDRFARDMASLQAGEDPRPAVENFLPAVLMAARVAIRIAGRDRVVGILAKLVAKLISRYVGADSATALSKALVDTGLRLMSLETTPEMERRAAGYTLASTVEDTVNRLAASVPAEAWEAEGMLEGYIQEAFEQSASANFPDTHIRGELREAPTQPGAWVLMPLARQGKRYKKYTRVIEVKLTPQMAKCVRTFGRVPLSTVLLDRYGVSPGATVQARVHLYEAIRGTTLSHVAFHEKRLAGLGSAGRSAWTLLHPLTPCAAAILFQECGLGSDVAPRFLSNRNWIQVGQRFYCLEIPGVTPRPLPPVSKKIPGARYEGAPILNLALDFQKRQIRLFMFFPEGMAQGLKGALRSRPAQAVPGLLTSGLKQALSAVLSGTEPKQLRIVHESVPTQSFLSAPVMRILQLAWPFLAEWIAGQVLDALQKEMERNHQGFVDRFSKAADQHAGLTLCLTFHGPAFLEKLGALVRNPLTASPVLGGFFFAKAAVSSVTLDIKPGGCFA